MIKTIFLIIGIAIISIGFIPLFEYGSERPEPDQSSKCSVVSVYCISAIRYRKYPHLYRFQKKVSHCLGDVTATQMGLTLPVAGFS